MTSTPPPPTRPSPKASGASPRSKLELPGEPPRWRGPVIAVGVVLAIGFTIRATMQREPESAPATPAPSAAPIATATASASPSEDAALPSAPRCAQVGSESFTIGDAPVARRERDPDGGEEEEIDSPFAVEVGRGTSFSGGFAVGALRDAEGGTVATIVTLDARGGGGKIVRLARARGDVDAPVVAGFGDSVLAAMAEPNAGGRALKIAKVTGESITWGPELSQGRDESPAYDLAVGASRAVIVWDDPSPDSKRSNVVMATFDPTTLKSVTMPRPVSAPKVDADSPRVIPRAGGFWLAWVARGEQEEPHPSKAKDETGTPKKQAKDGNEDETDQGETIGAAWVEVVPLDENGAPTGSPRRATPKAGHVLAFDLEPGDDGAAILAWRDDDTPTGSSGGSVSTALVRQGGVGEARLVADEGVGTGVPDLLPGWIAISSLTGPKRLAPTSGTGELVGALEPESALGLGELLATGKDGMLLAIPSGKAMRLSVVRCVAPEKADAGTK